MLKHSASIAERIKEYRTRNKITLSDLEAMTGGPGSNNQPIRARAASSKDRRSQRDGRSYAGQSYVAARIRCADGCIPAGGHSLRRELFCSHCWLNSRRVSNSGHAGHHWVRFYPLPRRRALLLPAGQWGFDDRGRNQHRRPGTDPAAAQCREWPDRGRP